MDQGDERQVSVTYATLVGVNMTNDDMLLEFWQYRVGQTVPELPPEEVAKKIEPVLRVVVPFFSAKWLRDYLIKAVPVIEENRKAGQ